MASNLRKYCQLMEGLLSIWKEWNFISRFWPSLIPWFWCLTYMTILLRLSVYFNCIFCENTFDLNKFKFYDKLIAGKKMSNLRRIVMSIKHQNPGINLYKNCQKNFCSFQLMEGNPSNSWKYFHRLEAFHLLAFGYNWFMGLDFF